MDAARILKLVALALLDAVNAEESFETKATIAEKTPQVEEVLKRVTLKEREVLELIHRQPGLPVKQLATALKKSEGSVKAQLSSLYRKFDVNGRVDLISKIRPFFPKA